ncbi:hypothetical protein Cgig2_030229 [Carnegiea gigantea]|uniref:23 kDa subunit of oxygen evolving system of photosystem II n=1 Tax=Carnegiea gigantea TaxID=171969 RepID=A0A9Q1QIR2_9CARY|nr:hypothetical protein Cgig2_030229 [Carnegiea gigantea]
MASTACFLQHHATAISGPLAARSPVSQRNLTVGSRPNQVVCEAQKVEEEKGNLVNGNLSRRLALSVLIGAAAAVGSKVSPADAPKTNTDFLSYNGDGFKLMIPSKWNPSKEVEYPGQVLRCEDNFDATTNVIVAITPTDKKSITDYGSPDEFLSQVNYLLGQQAYFGKIDAEGGFDSDVATANILETNSPVTDGRQLYLSVLTRTADGDEGGKHQLISATVKDGKLYICKAQAGDKRWFKGARRFVESTANSFQVA